MQMSRQINVNGVDQNMDAPQETGRLFNKHLTPEIKAIITSSSFNTEFMFISGDMVGGFFTDAVLSVVVNKVHLK